MRQMQSIGTSQELYEEPMGKAENAIHVQEVSLKNAVTRSAQVAALSILFVLSRVLLTMGNIEGKRCRSDMLVWKNRKDVCRFIINIIIVIIMNVLISTTIKVLTIIINIIHSIIMVLERKRSKT